jgi:hypothetical protein
MPVGGDADEPALDPAWDGVVVLEEFSKERAAWDC